MSNQNNKRKIMQAMKDLKVPAKYINNYVGADSYFNTIYQTGILKERFFIESQQFTDSSGQAPFAPDYKIKMIAESRVSTFLGKSFESVEDAEDFLESFDLTKNFNAIKRGSVPSYNFFLAEVGGMGRLYDDGLTACYYDYEKALIKTYCEGDTADILCDGRVRMEIELQDHKAYYEEC